jgi:acyl-CoA synthetase (NDP forming)
MSSDEGGVVVNIPDERALKAAFEAMLLRFAGRASSFLLMEQMPAGREVIVGSKASPGLGSLVLFGLGGVFVEVIKDVSVSVAPLSRPEARDAMRLIKGHKMLEGLRGQPPVDLAALEDLLIRVSRLASDFPEIAEMDLNPVFAYPEGRAPVAVDARVRVS